MWVCTSKSFRENHLKVRPLSCPLCRKEKLTRWFHSDEVCWVAYCSSHPDKILIVLNRHARLPTPEEAEYMSQIADKLFPGKAWRYPRSILDHFHLHEV